MVYHEFQKVPCDTITVLHGPATVPQCVNYLVLFPHGGQGLHVVLAVFALLQTLVAHGGLAAGAVHAVVLRFVIHAGRLFARGGAGRLRGPRPRWSRRQQPVLGQRSAGGVAALLARSAVENIALLAHHRGVHRVAVAQLAFDGGGAALLVAGHDRLQQPVALEAAEPALLQGHAAVAQRAGDGAVAVHHQSRREHAHSVGRLEARRV